VPDCRGGKELFVAVLPGCKAISQPAFAGRQAQNKGVLLFLEHQQRRKKQVGPHCGATAQQAKT